MRPSSLGDAALVAVADGDCHEHIPSCFTISAFAQPSAPRASGSGAEFAAPGYWKPCLFGTPAIAVTACKCRGNARKFSSIYVGAWKVETLPPVAGRAIGTRRRRPGPCGGRRRRATWAGTGAGAHPASAAAGSCGAVSSPHASAAREGATSLPSRPGPTPGPHLLASDTIHPASRRAVAQLSTGQVRTLGNTHQTASAEVRSRGFCAQVRHIKRLARPLQPGYTVRVCSTSIRS